MARDDYRSETCGESLAMNAISFGAVARKRVTINTGEQKPEPPLDAAWNVLEAANDLRDDVTVEVCRRVIDANLIGMPASASDLHIIAEYFR
jgi:hypothetical protein